MKRQYLGNSRDHFKWDYHDQLVRALGADELQVVNRRAILTTFRRPILTRG
jgi:hypothetical protein